MRPRYRYAAVGAALGIVAALLMALPVLVVGQFFLKADHALGKPVFYGSCAVLAFFAVLPTVAGYSIGRKREAAAPTAPDAAPASPPAPPGPLSLVQILLGAVGAVLGAAFAYIGFIGSLILSVFVIPAPLMRRIDAAPASAHQAVSVGFIAAVVLAGWAGFRICASLGRRRD
jgi:hypothetical protein